MDNTIDDWDKCTKIDTWLTMPYFPVYSRKNLFKKYRVNSFPFMVVGDKDSKIEIPRQILSGEISEIENYVNYAINCFDVESFVLV